MPDHSNQRRTFPFQEFKRQPTWSPARKWLIQGSANEKPIASLVRNEISRAVTELGLAIPLLPDNFKAEVSVLVASSLRDIDLDRKVIVVGSSDEANDLLKSGQSETPDNVVALTCGSGYARNALLNSGLGTPVVNIGMGVDHWERVLPSRSFSAPGKRYKFLHVSACAEADGIDILLEAFGRLFDSSDDVSLLIQPLGGLSPNLQSQVALFRSTSSEYPDVILLQDDLPEADVKALYGACQVFLAPSRSEAFGLPIAQALMSGLAVVTTAWGGPMDYCDEDSCWLVDYSYKGITTSHGAVTSVGIEPKPESLDRAIWGAYCSEPQVRFNKARRGRQRLLSGFTWKDVALRLANVAELGGRRRSKSKIGLVTTWNVKCGIGVYTEHLFSSCSADELVVFAARQEPRTRNDDQNVFRSWDVTKAGNGFHEVRSQIVEQGVDCLIIQFNFEFFNHDELSELIMSAVSAGVAVVVDLHSTTNPYGDVANYRLSDFLGPLQKCDRVLVHNLSDMEKLKDLGLVANVLLFPLGVLNRSDARSRIANVPRSKPLITSFGFCFDTKGLIELVEAMDILRNEGEQTRLRMLNAQYHNQHSKDLVQRIRLEIKKRNLEDEIDFNSEYLDDETCLSLITEADLFVNPYQRTNESASAAVRYGLATGVPVAVTPLPFFNDLGEAVFRMPGTSPREIADGIKTTLAHLRENSQVARKTSSAAQEWLLEHDYTRLGMRLTRLVHALVVSNRLVDKGLCW